MHIDKRLLTRMMPRLAIQMLVENAIKHGISRSVDPAELKVVMGYQKGHQESQACHETYESRWFIKVTNPADFNLAQTNSGMGLAYLEQRLSLSFGDESSVTLTTWNSKVEVRIEIKNGIKKT